MTADPRPTVANPLLQLHTEAGGSREARAEAVRTYAFAVPTDDALDLIAAVSPAGVVEVGAGTGYWASLLAAKGVDVVAYDIAPAPSAENHLFRGREPWFPVQVGDELAAATHPDRTLLVVWPTYDEVWPANALERFHEGGGQRVAFVGEPPGGLTGDDRFHALLGTVDRCAGCAYGAEAAACTCGIAPLWRATHQVRLPSWGDGIDHLQVFERRDDPAPDRTEGAGSGAEAAPAGRGGLRRRLRRPRRDRPAPPAPGPPAP